MVYRDEDGTEYVRVLLPTREVTGAVPIQARVVGRLSVRGVPRSRYAGVDGECLSAEPAHRRRYWTDEQWLAFWEHRRMRDDRFGDEPAGHPPVIVRS